LIKVRFDHLSEHRMLYIVYWCAVKGAFFKRTRPLSEWRNE